MFLYYKSRAQWPVASPGAVEREIPGRLKKAFGCHQISCLNSPSPSSSSTDYFTFWSPDSCRNWSLPGHWCVCSRSFLHVTHSDDMIWEETHILRRAHTSFTFYCADHPVTKICSLKRQLRKINHSGDKRVCSSFTGGDVSSWGPGWSKTISHGVKIVAHEIRFLVEH